MEEGSEIGRSLEIYSFVYHICRLMDYVVKTRQSKTCQERFTWCISCCYYTIFIKTTYKNTSLKFGSKLNSN